MKQSDLKELSQHLTVLYVEDNQELREGVLQILSGFFLKVDSAVDGVEGLAKYNQNEYDIVISDLTMPNMNGLEMIHAIREIKPEQKCIPLTAHDENDMLKQLLHLGVNGIIQKPINIDSMINTLYQVSRDCTIEKQNRELVLKINTQSNVIEVKSKQLEQTFFAQPMPKVEIDYFKVDEDEGNENVLFLLEDRDEVVEVLNELSDLCIALDIQKITKGLASISYLFMHYSPYMDGVSGAFLDLSLALMEDEIATIDIFKDDLSSIISLFDAVSSDLEKFMDRFMVESMAMKNTHHIHKPTELSISQIIQIIKPSESSDIEFF